jgi:hypothetical protein
MLQKVDINGAISIVIYMTIELYAHMINVRGTPSHVNLDHLALHDQYMSTIGYDVNDSILYSTFAISAYKGGICALLSI